MPIVEVLEELDVIIKADQELKYLIDSLTENPKSGKPYKLDEEESELYEIAKMEKEQSHLHQEVVEEKLVNLLIPTDACSKVSSITMEFLAGAGGHEAGLFAGDLVRMYRCLAMQKGWKFEVLDAQKMTSNNLVDNTSLESLITGSLPIAQAHVILDATSTDEETKLYQLMRNEGGVHRVQRIPVTSKLNKIHTSTVAVVVLPFRDEVEINLDEKDLKWEAFRSSGAGGQHVNKTDSAVRLTHLSSGIVISCQKERSLHENRRIALKMLKDRLLEQIVNHQQLQIGSERKSQAGSLERSEKIRTYNFQQDRVTDHRLGHSWTGMYRFLGEDNCDYLIDALSRLDRQFKLNKLRKLLDEIKT